MKERLIPFPRLETCFRDGLHVPLQLHAYLAFINKITAKPTKVLPKEWKSLISFIQQCRNLSQMSLFPPSFPFGSKYLTSGHRDKLFYLNTRQNIRKDKTPEHRPHLPQGTVKSTPKIHQWNANLALTAETKSCQFKVPTQILSLWKNMRLKSCHEINPHSFNTANKLTVPQSPAPDQCPDIPCCCCVRWCMEPEGANPKNSALAEIFVSLQSKGWSSHPLKEMFLSHE